MPSLHTVLRQIGRKIYRALPGVATPASRMHSRAQSQQPWQNVPPHQQASAFTQHQNTLHQLRQQHVMQKVAPAIVDWFYQLIVSPKFWDPVVYLAFLCFILGSCVRS